MQAVERGLTWQHMRPPCLLLDSTIYWASESYVGILMAETLWYYASSYQKSNSVSAAVCEQSPSPSWQPWGITPENPHAARLNEPDVTRGQSV